MTGSKSSYFGNKILRWIAGQAMPPAPTTVYLALFNSRAEVTTTVRVAGRAAIVWAVPASGTTNMMSPSADVDFGLARGGTEVDELRIYDAASSGNILYAMAIAPTIIDAGDRVKVDVADLVLIEP
jgi:hypothetical protein